MWGNSIFCQSINRLFGRRSFWTNTYSISQSTSTYKELYPVFERFDVFRWYADHDSWKPCKYTDRTWRRSHIRHTATDTCEVRISWHDMNNENIRYTIVPLYNYKQLLMNQTSDFIIMMMLMLMMMMMMMMMIQGSDIFSLIKDIWIIW